ncbi:SRPBCC family protein [Rhodococcus sp. DMU2021]|uniref:SRPBCC family protein n=1 Tax=Rhodococcus sp. DMU2021 TaxID=2866997 RepID=UPI001C7D6808|nr:SRPBCC family protein [Rhodococcus sp. DMU2021]MBX4167642.1 SRPBCC family protein [Rhodococcus sp. DMU2021]
MVAMQTTPLTFESSVVVSATPDEVYALVSDVTRTGEWSPVCAECWWDEGQGPEVGSFFTGRNVTPERIWEARSKVVVASPGREFAWSVGPGLVRWSYVIKPADAGTELTETWEFTEAGQKLFHEKLGAKAPARIAAREQAARSGIPATLDAIKRIIEG